MIVLVVDDEKEMRFVLKDFLEVFFPEAENYFTGSGEEALALPAIKPDVIIFDYHLPGMNGVQMIDQMIKNNLISPSVLLVSMSGDASETDRKKEAEQSGISIQFFLKKPFRLSELKRIIETAL